MKTRIFVTYSHEDHATLEELRPFLEPLGRHGIRFWDDERIDPGEDWDAKIQAALAECESAIVLISQASLRSEYILDRELSVLLRRWSAGEVRLLCLYVDTTSDTARRIDYVDHEGEPASIDLASLQAVDGNSPDDYLTKLDQPWRRKEVYKELARTVRLHFEPKAEQRLESAPPPEREPSNEETPESSPDDESREKRETPAPPSFWKNEANHPKILIGAVLAVFAVFTAYMIIRDGPRREAASGLLNAFVEQVAPASLSTAPAADDGAVAKGIAALVGTPFFFGGDRLETEGAVEQRFAEVLKAAHDYDAEADRGQTAFDKAVAFVAEARKSARDGRVVIDEVKVDPSPTDDTIAADPFLSPPDDYVEDFSHASFGLVGVKDEILKQVLLFTDLDESGAGRIRGIKFR